jgi:hypothetical protein
LAKRATAARRSDVLLTTGKQSSSVARQARPQGGVNESVPMECWGDDWTVGVAVRRERDPEIGIAKFRG